MNKLFFLFWILVLLLPVADAMIIEPGIQFEPSASNAIYNITLKINGLTNVTLNSTCLIMQGNESYGEYCDIYGSPTYVNLPTNFNPTLEFTGQTPSNGSYINADIKLNYTINYFNYTGANCTLYINNTPNQSQNNVLNGTHQFDYNLSLIDGQKLLNVTCIDNANKSYILSETKTIIQDTTDPTISTIGATYQTEMLNISINTSDINYKNISILGCNVAAHRDISSNPYYYTNDTQNISSCSFGEQLINITICDMANNCIYVNFTYYNRGKLAIQAIAYNTSTINNFDIYADDVLQGSTTTGIYYIQNLTNTTHKINIRPQYYQWSEANITINETLMNYTFRDLYSTNSINISIYDDTTDVLVPNVTIELISDLYASNYTAPTGNTYIEFLTPEDYLIRYDADGYKENYYYFNLTNGTSSILTLYLSNESDASEITATVYDNINNKLEGALIQVLKYDISTNSYNLVGMAKTNLAGEALLYLYKNTEFYKFYIYYPESTLRLETNPTYIFQDTINFQITISEGVAETFYDVDGIDVSLTFNNDTNNFRFSYSDTGNVADNYCLTTYRISSNTYEQLDNQCLTASSGTILLNVSAINGTSYMAKATAEISGSYRQLSSLLKQFIDNNPAGSMGIFATLFICIVLAFISIYSISLACVITPLPIIINAAIGLINLNISYAIGLEIIGIIVALALDKW